MDPLNRILHETSREMKKLSPKLKNLLLQGVKQVGSYDPDEVFPYIEEQLTGAEYVVAQGFLTWMCENDLTFGHGNINQRFDEYARSN